MNDNKKSLKTKYSDRPRSKKVQLILALVFTVTLMITIPVLAWFSHQRNIATMAKINSPASLNLKAGHEEDIIQLKLSGINVGDENTSGSKDFVFSVEGKDVSGYKLQLAHTTNIKFTYSIYKAIELAANEDGAVKYVTANEEDIYYRKTIALAGSYVNNTTKNSRTIGNNQYTDKSYTNGESIQDFAEPLYWQVTSAINPKEIYEGTTSYNAYSGVSGKDKEFLNYYVLHVEWDASVINDKETDIVYITAKVQK